MRKVKLQMQITLDGFVAGPNGEQDWMAWNWDDVLKQHSAGLCESTDTILLGRMTYQEMASYWPAAATNPESTAEDIAFAHWMNDTLKIVFSNTLTSAEWKNSTLAKSTLAEEISQLKQQPGKDFILYGGAGIVSSFIQEDLIDEYHLFVNPVALGNGMPIFKALDNKRPLKLIQTKTSHVGIVVLCYEPVK